MTETTYQANNKYENDQDGESIAGYARRTSIRDSMDLSSAADKKDRIWYRTAQIWHSKRRLVS